MVHRRNRKYTVIVHKNTFHSRHLLDTINKRSLYVVLYGATYVSNNAATRSLARSRDYGVCVGVRACVYHFVSGSTRSILTG